MQYIFGTKGLHFFWNMQQHIEATSVHFKSWYAQHNEWLPKFLALITNQYQVYNDLMILINFGDQNNFKEKMKIYVNEKVLEPNDLKNLEEKIDKSWAYTSSIHKTMETVPNYRNRFAKLLATNYLRDYFNALNGIFFHLSTLDPKTDGKNILKCVQKKDSLLKQSMLEMKNVTTKIVDLVSDLANHAIAFGNAFATMEKGYADKNASDSQLTKETFQKNFSTFSEKFDQFLGVVDTTSNDVKTALTNEGKKLGPIFSIIHQHLEKFPAELINASGIKK